VEFVKTFGIHVREIRFQEPKDIKKTENFYFSYAKCVSTILQNAPNLECLKLNVYDYKLHSPQELPYSPTFLQLRKMNIRVTLLFETGKAESIIRKLVQSAPCLEIIKLHSTGPDSSFDSSDFLGKLPQLFKHLPLRCTLGLPFITLKDTVRGVMKDLSRSKFRIQSIFICDLDFKNADAFWLFWKWMTTQPLKKLEIHVTQISVPRVVLKGNRSIILESCRKLTLGSVCQTLFRKPHFQFPNLIHLTLSDITREGLKELSHNFPQIQHLTCDRIGDAFHTLAGAGQMDNALEILLGVRKPNPTPFGKLTCKCHQYLKLLHILYMILFF